MLDPTTAPAVNMSAPALQVVMLALLAVAAWVDVRSQRIPNLLVVCGLVVGIVGNGTIVSGGWTFALLGASIGFLLFLPLYMLRAMGAGDVKLMAMVGAFLGPAGAIIAVLLSFAAGGVLACAYAVARGTARRLLINLASIVRGAALTAATGVGGFGAPAPDTSAGKFPYSVAIAIGSIGSIALARL